MTQKRAQEIWNNRGICNALPFAFPDRHRGADQCIPTGISAEEDAEIAALWGKMIGGACYFDAFAVFLNGKDERP